jgi:Fe-S oxidoreductase
LLDDLDAEAAKGPSGLAVGEPLALALIEASKTIHDSGLVSRVVNLHRQACAGACGARVLSSACSAIVACDRCDAACDFYETEMAAKRIWPDASLTSSLLKCAAQAGRSELAERLASHAGKMRSSTSGTAAAAKDELSRQASMMKAYARDHNLASATKVFKNLRSSGTALNSLIYNSYLDACVQCGDLDAAIPHFQEMKQLNYSRRGWIQHPSKGILDEGAFPRSTGFGERNDCSRVSAKQSYFQ